METQTYWAKVYDRTRTKLKAHYGLTVQEFRRSKSSICEMCVVAYKVNNHKLHRQCIDRSKCACKGPDHL